MLSKKQSTSQLGLYGTFQEQLNHSNPLYILANKINWGVFEEAIAKLYSKVGLPAKPICLMVSLLMLKQIPNISDESAAEQWSENCNYKYFGGEKLFAFGITCKTSKPVFFRHRIGEKSIELIFRESISINCNDSIELYVGEGTKVQENNIIYN